MQWSNYFLENKPKPRGVLHFIAQYIYVIIYTKKGLWCKLKLDPFVGRARSSKVP